jgi:hypothetical protein
VERGLLPPSDHGRFGKPSPEQTEPFVGPFSQPRGQYATQRDLFQLIEAISTSEAEGDSNFSSAHGCDDNEIVCDREEEDADDFDPDEEDDYVTDDEGCNFPDS